MMHLMISVLLFTVNFCVIFATETGVIQTEAGKVQGEVATTLFAGVNVQKFLNIPYAEPPVGRLRFAKPEPKKPWNGILKNSNVTVACWQNSNEPDVKLSEDCLTLNIWTPYPQNSGRKVMVWFHGGAFILGMGNSYLGYNFVGIGQVILVTVNFRLSVLGFFTTGDDRVKGNFGLFDQRLALKWVKKNIAQFGGDPDSITIFGQSSGGASASAHTLSEKSWPYFDKAIFQSGLITMPWMLSSKQNIENSLNVLLKSVNCVNDNNLLKCLQSNTTDEFLQEITKVSTDMTLLPWVDGDFLTEDPATLLKDGKVKKCPVILGVTKDESYFMGARDLLKLTRNLTEIMTQYEGLVKRHFKKSSEAVHKEALKLYNPKCTPSFIEAIRPMVDFGSDTLFICATVNEARKRVQMLNGSDVYMYRYSFNSAVAMISFLYHEETFGFVTHGSDIHATFGDPILDQHFPAEDQILSLRMILYWTNFAKHGDPNVGTTKLPIVLNKIDSLPKWPKYTNSTREYLDMESLSRMVVGTKLREPYCEFLSDPQGFTNKTNEMTTKEPSKKPTTCAAVKHIPQLALLTIVVLKTIS